MVASDLHKSVVARIAPCSSKNNDKKTGSGWVWQCMPIGETEGGGSGGESKCGLHIETLRHTQSQRVIGQAPNRQQ